MLDTTIQQQLLITLFETHGAPRLATMGICTSLLALIYVESQEKSHPCLWTVRRTNPGKGLLIILLFNRGNYLQYVATLAFKNLG